MIDTRLIGPKDDQYAVLSLGTVWLATTKKPYAEAVSAAVAAAIAGGGATDALPSEMGTIPTAETPITQALVSMLEAGWLSLGSSAPGAVKPLVEALEVFERENADLKQRILPQFQGLTQRAEHERDALLEQLIKANEAADTMEEFLGAAARHEKQASAIINSVASDIAITTPFRDYSGMSPLDCYEAGLMDGVSALKKQINEAIDAALREGGAPIAKGGA